MTHTHSDTVLVTGAAGFIGSHLAAKLIERGNQVVGLDNLNPYYDVNLKRARVDGLQSFDNFDFVQGDLTDYALVQDLFSNYGFRSVAHMAAQAGVRYSLTNPHSYVSSNVDGFLNILEACRAYPVDHLVFASTSSVYGANTKYPFSEHDNVDHPVSLYAATKKANELMAHSYAHLFGTPCTGLRFFTVYGPWGRPDMAAFKFMHNMLNDKPIEIYNHGHMERDFTYIDDVVEGVIQVLDTPAEPNEHWSGQSPDPATSYAPYRIFNIGNSQPVDLMRFIQAIEHEMGFEAKKQYLPLQPGDVPKTYADTSNLQQAIGYRPQTSVEHGVKEFVEWYLGYYEYDNV